MVLTQRNFSIDLEGSKIDPANSTIRQVSLISLGEAKGHDVFVDEKTLAQVFNRLTQLGSLKVKADHGSGVLSTIGYVDGFECGDGKVLGDFHVYESEPERPRIFEIASKNPHHLGMSLEFEGEDQKKDGKYYARCSDISAVALVSDPAANKSLFEKSKNTVDSNQHSGNKQNMATKRYDDKPEDKMPDDQDDQKTFDDDVTPADDANTGDQFSKLMSRFDALEARMNKYDEGAVNKEDDGKPALPATNPNAEPKANNNGPLQVNQEKGGAMKGDEPGANPTGPWEGMEKKFAEIAEKAALSAAEKTARHFGAALGIRSLPSRSVPMETGRIASKTYAQLVSEKKKELEAKGDSNPSVNAELFCLKNYKKEYAESRLVRTL